MSCTPQQPAPEHSNNFESQDGAQGGGGLVGIHLLRAGSPNTLPEQHQSLAVRETVGVEQCTQSAELRDKH